MVRHNVDLVMEFYQRVLQPREILRLAEPGFCQKMSPGSLVLVATKNVFFEKVRRQNEKKIGFTHILGTPTVLFA